MTDRSFELKAIARRELLDLAITAAGVGTFDWNLVTGELVWDDRLIELFGYDRTTFDRSIDAFNARVHPDDLAEVSSSLQKAIDARGEFVAEYRIVLPGGQVRWIGARGHVLSDESGRAVQLLGAAWDNTARAEGEARVARVMESMSTAFFSLDASWRFTYVNAEAERVLGRARSELLGGVIWEQFPAALGSEFEVHYRKAMDEGERVAFDAYYPAPLDAWYEVRAWRTADGLAVYFLDVTSSHRARKSAERAQRRTAVLARITDELTGTLVFEEAAQRLADVVVPDLADWCIVTLIDDSAAAGAVRGLGAVTAKHSNDADQPTLDAYATARLSAITDDAIIVRALETGRPQYVHSDAEQAVSGMFESASIRDLMARLAPAAVGVLPLNGRSGPIGMLSIANGADRGDFTADDIATLDHVGARAGLVMENARLYRQQLELAESLQRTLLTEPPEPDHAEIVVRYLPAAEAAQVGGDWYDSFMQTNGNTVLVIGDVVGHNAASAAAMSQVRTLLRGIGALSDDGPAEILRKTDRVLETLQVDTDATAIVVRLEQTPEERSQGISRVRWSSAGHPPPMVLDLDGTVSQLHAPTADLFLGVMPELERHEYEATLQRGATVVLYTDGLVERRNQSIEQGLSRLQQTLGQLEDRTLSEMCDELIERMRPSDSEDDVALIAVRLHRQDRSRPAEAGENHIPPNIPSE